MEYQSGPEDNSKLYNPEWHEAINQGERDAKEIQEWLDDSLEHLKCTIEILEGDAAYLEHMKANNDFIKESIEEFGTEPEGIRHYSEEEIAQVRKNIEIAEIDIKSINDFMSGLQIDKATINGQVEDFQKMQEQFRAAVLKIDQSSLN